MALDMRSWHFKKLGAFLSQQDTDVWNGDLKEKAVDYRANIGIDSTTFNNISAYNCYFYVLKIPKGATKIKISANVGINPAGVSACRRGFSNSADATHWNNVTITQSATPWTINIPNGYTFFGLTIRPSSLSATNVTFEFSKNSGGGTKLLTYLLNLIKRRLSQ